MKFIKRSQLNEVWASMDTDIIDPYDAETIESTFGEEFWTRFSRHLSLATSKKYTLSHFDYDSDFAKMEIELHCENTGKTLEIETNWQESEDPINPSVFLRIPENGESFAGNFTLDFNGRDLAKSIAGILKNQFTSEGLMPGLMEFLEMGYSSINDPEIFSNKVKDHLITHFDLTEEEADFLVNENQEYIWGMMENGEHPHEVAEKLA